MRKGETQYTELYVIRELKSFLRNLLKNKAIIYQGELLEKKKYSKEFVAEMIAKHKDNRIIKSLHQKIKTILETRAVKYGLGLGTTNAGKTNAAFFIFFMKNAYGWKDNNTIDHNINLPTPILGSLSPRKAEIKAPVKYIEEDNQYIKPEKSEEIAAVQGVV